MKTLLRLAVVPLLLGLVLVSVPTDGSPSLEAPVNAEAGPGACICTGTAEGYEYPSNFVGSESGGSHQGDASDNADCAANKCQPWMWDMGADVCDDHDLNNGVGYVILDWRWYFYGSPNDNGHLEQQYHCDDL